MSSLTVKGGTPLRGEVAASGAKNAALPILAACILMDGEYELRNVPHLLDITTMLRMLNALGIRAEFRSDNCVKIWNEKKVRHIAPYELVTAMRASFFVAGPILAKTGLAKVPLPGGCAIGSRPIDLHLKGFESLGATVSIEHGFVELKANKLVGKSISLDFPSVGATENLMMAATLAKGTTVINNAALEPEITDLGHFLNQGGAKIEGLGSSRLVIEGVDALRGVAYPVISDRVEIGTLLIAGLITRGDVTVANASAEHLQAVLDKMESAGAEITVSPSKIRAKYKKSLKAVDIETAPYPGFPTDMQAQMMSLLTVAKGTSVVSEKIFENRFMHAHELKRMGAKIKVLGHECQVSGPVQLSSAQVKITDLRAGAALILAGLAAQGDTVVYGLHHLVRGYDNLPKKLRGLGGSIVD